MSDGQLRHVVVYRALQRPNLLLGGERELVLTALLLAGALVFSALNLPAFVVGSLLYAISLLALRRMARADPLMSHVYRRHLRYAAFYAAKRVNARR